MRNKRIVILVCAIVAAAYLSRGSGDELRDMPSRTADVREIYAYEDVGRLAASSELVVEATVTEVIAVATTDPDDDTERRVRLDVDEVLYRRDGAEAPGSLLLAEGFWGPDGEGVAVGAMEWTGPGDTGYYFLSRGGTAPYGYVSQNYGRVMTTDGIAHLGGSGGLDPEADGPWAGSGADFADLDGIRAIIEAAVADAESGRAAPAERP